MAETDPSIAVGIVEVVAVDASSSAPVVAQPDSNAPKKGDDAVSLSSEEDEDEDDDSSEGEEEAEEEENEPNQEDTTKNVTNSADAAQQSQRGVEKKKPYVRPAFVVQDKLSPEELEKKMIAMRENNAKLMARKVQVDEDESEYKALEEASRVKAEARKYEQAQIDSDRREAAERKLGKLQGREWDREKKDQDWNHSRPLAESFMNNDTFRGRGGGGRGEYRGRGQRGNRGGDSSYAPRGRGQGRGSYGPRGRGGSSSQTPSTETPPRVTDETEFPSLGQSGQGIEADGAQ